MTGGSSDRHTEQPVPGLPKCLSITFGRSGPVLCLMRAIGVLLLASCLLKAPISRGNPRGSVLRSRNHSVMSKSSGLSPAKQAHGHLDPCPPKHEYFQAGFSQLGVYLAGALVSLCLWEEEGDRSCRLVLLTSLQAEGCADPTNERGWAECPGAS